jgi:leucyl-tRNA synthetase
MKNLYNAKILEKKWQDRWEKEKTFDARDASNKEKCYVLSMFPYPSGDGLHVGHVENYTAIDIYARFKRMRGFEVMHPVGWDAFGLPAENFAIKTGIHPDEKTHQNIANFTRQIKSLGISYDWSREIDTSSPEYYRWTQWFFLFLYKNGLAYRKQASVNWCASCQTVLANEQVVNGACERCKTEVTQKNLKQWFFKITDFIESQMMGDREVAGLIAGLEKLKWPESTKKAQQNWIGRSEGALVKFAIRQLESHIEVFTTRVDTIFGCSFVVVAPEHPLVKLCRESVGNWSEVKVYLEATTKKTELERTELSKEKTGVRLEGIEAINPFTDEAVPVFVADYVLGNYGTGAVMAVPAHDERDFFFAQKYHLPIVVSVVPSSKEEKECFIEDGILADSGEFSGLESKEAREKMMDWLKERNLGGKKVNYHLRDWLVSRQRYWGAPIPILYCKDCGEVAVPEQDLPVKLPTDVDFRPTGESPLTRSESFHQVKCPQCGKLARRESDTMDTFVCSSWYYLRFADPHGNETFANAKELKRWLPVDVYMGGAEHTVLHLLYARFITKVLCKYGLVDFDEPFVQLKHQGMVLAEDGRKMSKSLGNVVNPDVVVKQFGADSLRLYEMFMGPLEESKSWKTDNLVGPRRFLEKVWRMSEKVAPFDAIISVNGKVRSLLHKTMQKVTQDIEAFRFNTVVSSLMVLANEMDRDEVIAREDFERLVLMLSPLAPHIAEELWEKLEHTMTIAFEEWPVWSEQFLHDEMIEMVVQVNGKVRTKIMMEANISEIKAQELALQNEKVLLYIQGKKTQKTIFVPNRLLNIVI